MTLIMNRETVTKTGTPNRSIGRDLIGIGAIIAASAVGYLLFPDNLALLTRIIAIALLVLSLDLVTGYCGVATLGHAALFGSGAYAAGIAAAHYGITNPFLMTLAGVLGGAIAGLVCGVIILRAHGLPQLVLSISLIYLFHEFANKASSWTGGSDGLSGISPEPLFGTYAFDLWGRRPTSSASFSCFPSLCCCVSWCARRSVCFAVASRKIRCASWPWALHQR
jgi:branched-chain amino acid transport system permease protein